MKLIIGNQNYSTWSLRPWLLLNAFALEFDCEKVSLNADGLRDRLLQISPTARVPVLIDQGQVIYDSLAICEYVNERYLNGQAWPAEPFARAQARSLTCEMHAGFFAIRGKLPMNIRARRKLVLGTAEQQEIARIDAIFSAHHASGWLFESFGIVDCFYAPVASRFRTYGVELSAAAQAYADRLLAHPAMQAWTEQALEEDEILPVDEAGEEL